MSVQHRCRIAGLIIATLAAAAPAGEMVWLEAEDFVRSNWPGGHEGTGFFAPEDATQAAKLSGGKWLNTGNPRKTLFADYELKVPATGSYSLYARRFWHHGPFRWRFDGGAWTDVTDHRTLIDYESIRKNVGAGWISLGPVELTEGSHSFRVELLRTTGAAAFDCFLLIDGPFTPRGAMKPGTKTNLAGPGTWAFEPGTDSFGAGCALDLSFLNEDVAGQSGRVTYRDGRFLLGDGRPVRFWGTGIGTHGLDIEALRYQARRLAKLGVNHVRIHESFFARGADSEITDVNDHLIDNCHRAVAAMRDEGIYTTISPFFVLTLKVQSGWNVPGLADGGDKPFGLLFWDKRMQEGYKAWIRELLTRPNPYTGVPLAADPSVYTFQLQNEDSLLFWTFMSNVPLAAQESLGKMYGDWLIERYGSLAEALAAWGGPRRKVTKETTFLADHFDRGVAGLLPAYFMTAQYAGGQTKRATDQREFLAHVMHTFNTDMAAYIRDELGYKGLISANNWRTADPLTLNDIERYTYTANDVIDAHHYVTGTHVNPTEGRRASYTVDAGDLFISSSALHRPRDLPTNYKMITGRPHIITECTWPQPNRFKAEAPLLVAAYASMSDLDGFLWFASGRVDYDIGMGKFQVNIPSIMGQFPATALMYRLGYVKTAPVVVHQQRPLADLWAGKFPIIAEDPGYDPNRDMTRPELTPSTKVDPLAYLVGRVEVSYGGRRRTPRVGRLQRYIDREAKTVTAATGEVKLDYGRGLLTIDTPKAQGATGFLQAVGDVDLATVHIEGRNEYGAVLLVALDDQPLATSRRILVQAMTEDWLYEFETVDAPLTTGKGDKKRTRPAKRITNMGRAPWNVVDIDVTVTVRNPHLNKATALDALGYRRHDVAGRAADGSFTVTLPADTLYTILE